jgi:hypothetical protein
MRPWDGEESLKLIEAIYYQMGNWIYRNAPYRLSNKEYFAVFSRCIISPSLLSLQSMGFSSY